MRDIFDFYAKILNSPSRAATQVYSYAGIHACDGLGAEHAGGSLCIFVNELIHQIIWDLSIIKPATPFVSQPYSLPL